jgi:hypothetical protein
VAAEDLASGDTGVSTAASHASAVEVKTCAGRQATRGAAPRHPAASR